jgi:hypothetical protein
MKRLATYTLAAIALVGALASASSASAVLPATPRDGAKVALSAYGQAVYEYPYGSGNWYFDGGVSNNSASVYLTGATVVRPTVTIEYRNSGLMSVGTETFEVDANIMPCNQGNGNPIGAYYRLFHRRLTLPPGADPYQTRPAPEVAPSDPQWPKYQYGIAAKGARHQSLPSVSGPIDTSLGEGRTQYTATVTNNTTRTVGPVRYWGNEVFGMNTSTISLLDSYEVTALDPAKASRLAPGESTTFLVRGLAATPGGMNRYTDWNAYAEGEPLADVKGVVASNFGLEGGVTVSVPGRDPVLTAPNGTYTVPAVLPGTYVVTFAKPGYRIDTRTITVSWDDSVSCGTSLTRIAQPFTPRRPTISGKPSARRGVTFKGTLAPNYGPILIEVQAKKKRGGWKKYSTYSANSVIAGPWSRKVRLKKGTYRVRISTRSWEAFMAGTSAWSTFTVK